MCQRQAYAVYRGRKKKEMWGDRRIYIFIYILVYYVLYEKMLNDLLRTYLYIYLYIGILYFI